MFVFSRTLAYITSDIFVLLISYTSLDIKLHLENTGKALHGPENRKGYLQFLHFANEESDGVIGGSTKTMQHSVKLRLSLEILKQIVL